VAIRRTFATLLVASELFVPGSPVAAAGPGSNVLAVDPSTSVVPGYVPFALLLALEAAAALVWVVIYTRRRTDAFDGLIMCSRCARLQQRTERLARAADAVAVGALAFVVALPFVAASYESGFMFASALLAASAVVAVVAAAAEADFLARAAAARLWPRLTWTAEPARIIGGGARWLGAIFALYLFQPETGLGALFGGVGKRLVLDLASTWTIWAAAAILVIAAIVALAARWLAPLASHSLPTTLATRHAPHRTSA
jgi:hypothetical protein